MSTHRRSPVALRLEELERRVTPTVTVVPQHFATNQYTALSITQGQLLAGDSGGPTLTVSNPTQPANASLVDNRNGTFTFTPQPSFTGSSTFQYTVNATSQTKLTAADAVGGDEFGNSVAIDGNTAVIGARFKAANGDNSVGAVYVFVRSGATWTQQAELTPADETAGEHFGDTVSVIGDTILVGTTFKAVNGNSNQGVAYVYVRSGTTWTQQAELTAADGGANDQFGSGVALSGNTAVIEAIGKPVKGFVIQGAAYVFTRSGATWTQQAELTETNVVGGALGKAVSISGDTIVVGGGAADVNQNEHRGAAFVFVRSGATWSQQAEIGSPAGLANDGFGRTVSVSGDTLIVGANITSVNGEDFHGAAYVYTRTGSTWTQQAQLTPSNPPPHEGFGSSVALSGDTAVVDAGLGNPPLEYVFVRSGTVWTQQASAFQAPGQSTDLSSVAISGNTALFGDPESLVSGQTPQGIAVVQDLGTATATATVQVNPATAQLFVAPATLPAGTEGQAYQGTTFTATGGAGSGYTFQQSGILPAGLTFNAATGQLAGTPNQVGIFPGIVIAAADGKGGSGSQTYTLFVTHYGVDGQPVPFPKTIYAPPTSKADPNAADHAFLRGLYHSVLDRDVESDASLNYWETLLSAVRADPGQFHLSSGTDPYQYVANTIWQSQEHRWREVESFYHDFLGRDLDLANAANVTERQYWANQFQFNGLSETDVVRSFITSPEYLFHHRGDASLTAVLNADLLAGKGAPIHLLAWTTALSKLDARRGSLQGQTFATPEAYKAQLAPDLSALDNETTHTGVLFDVLASDEYVQPALDSFYQAFDRRAGTTAEKQALLGLRDGNNNPLPLGSIAAMLLGAAEYRTNAVTTIA